jgi:hypothetical protein
MEVKRGVAYAGGRLILHGSYQGGGDTFAAALGPRVHL